MMRTIIYLLTFLVCCSDVYPAQASDIPQPKIVKFNDQIYLLQGPVVLPNKENRGYMVNSTLIIGRKGAILVDTGFSDEIGRLLKKTIATITSKPVTHVINTHYHGDHVLGNSEFSGAEIISSEKCRDLVNKRGYEWIGFLENATGATFPNTRPVAATRVFAEDTKTSVTLQGVKMQVWVPEGSHTPGDLMIYLPQYQLLISGDILVKQIAPSFIDAHVKTWIDTLDQITKIPVKTIIPGHGPMMTLDEVVAMRNRLVELYAGVEAGYKKGLTDSEIRETLDLSQWQKMAEYEALMGGNINHLYLEVEEANF